MFHSWSLCVGFFYAETCTFLHSAEFILLLHIFEHQKLPRCMHGSLFYMLAQIFIVMINC